MTSTMTTTTVPSNSLGEYLLKIVMVGNTGVGKTSLLLRYTDDCFSESFIATIGVDFKIKTLDMPDCTAKLQLWDTAGQDRFKSIIASFYRHTDGLVLVFDVTDPQSFDSISDWLKEAEQFGNEDCVKMLVGNKSDLTAKRVVEFDKAQALADKLGMVYVETSAKNATNVHQAFTSMAHTLVAQKKASRPTSLKPDAHADKLDISSRKVRSSHFNFCFMSDESCSLA